MFKGKCPAWLRRSPALAAVTLLLLSAATLTRGALIDEVRKNYSVKSTVSAEIDLTIWWEVREKEEKKSGYLLMAPGDKFDVSLGGSRWVCDGRTLWQYSGQSKQVVVKRLLDIDLSAHPSQILATYLMKYAYNVDATNESETVLSWHSDPTNPDREYRSISMTVDTRKAMVQRLEVTDINGNRSTYQFRKTRFGVKTGNTSFTFAIPEGTHVLDMRE